MCFFSGFDEMFDPLLLVVLFFLFRRFWLVFAPKLFNTKTTCCCVLLLVGRLPTKMVHEAQIKITLVVWVARSDENNAYYDGWSWSPILLPASLDQMPRFSKRLSRRKPGIQLFARPAASAAKPQLCTCEPGDQWPVEVLWDRPKVMATRKTCSKRHPTAMKSPN